MENRLAQPPCNNLYFGRYMLMVQQIKGALGVGLVLVSLEQIIIEKSLRLGFSTTNNEAEYETLLEGMSVVQRMGGKVVKMFSDSRLVVTCRPSEG